MKTTFKVNSNVDTCGTNRKSEILASYSRLVELFGEPIESDGYKVSGEWVFESETGGVVTLYDWKQTVLYDPDYPSIEEFRNQACGWFNIGAHKISDADDFVAWLTAQF